MFVRTASTYTSTAPRISPSILRPFLLTPIQSRKASDHSKLDPHPTETASFTRNAKESVQDLASDISDSMDSPGKSDTGTGSGHGVPGDTGNPIYDAADTVGSMHSKSSKNPSILSSGGSIGKQFNPDGNIGQIGEKIGGPFAKDGVIGRQFDASGGGIAGTVEKLVDGPSQKKPGDTEYKCPEKK